jgi:hypothetical protein
VTAGRDLPGRTSDDGGADRVLTCREWTRDVHAVCDDARDLLRQLERVELPEDAACAIAAGVRTMTEAADAGDLTLLQDTCAAIRLRLALAITEACR